MSRFKRSQAKYVKQTHTITNWPAYDQALVTRGSLTFWFTDDAIRKWTAPPSGRAGGQRKYSNLAIETALAFRMVFHLPWRQTKGCLQSLVELHGLTLEIPYPTTFSRRCLRHSLLIRPRFVVRTATRTSAAQLCQALCAGRSRECARPPQEGVERDRAP